MRRRSSELSNTERRATLDALYTAAGSLKTRDAAKDFLADLLTESEQIMLGRRILIARALLAGMTHDEVVAEFKVGKDTTMRIAKWLKALVPEFSTRSKNANNLSTLKKKHPSHFLFFPSDKR